MEKNFFSKTRMALKTKCLLTAALFFTLACSAAEVGKKDPVDYVNPYIGNISHLLVPTFPTIHLPNSILRVYPERGDFTGDLLRGLPLVVTSHRGSSAFNPVSYTHLTLPTIYSV